MEGGFVKVGWERKKAIGNQGIRVQKWGEKPNSRHFLGIFGLLRRGQASGVGRQILRFQTKESRMGVLNPK